MYVNLRNLSRGLLIFLWLLTFAAALVWVLMKEPPFDPEPATVLLGLVSSAVTALVNEYSRRLKKEEFSTSYALAYGYVNNFLEPVVTQLVKTQIAGSPKPRMMIYIPDRLNELEPKHIDRLMTRLREKSFTSNVVNVSLAEGRARDLLTVCKRGGEFVYFDFPTTLLTLNSYIDYKVESGKESFAEEEKIKLGKEYILTFKNALTKMLEQKQMTDYVAFTDKELNF